ncbi:hypothetical protein BDZ97DRAFT_1810022 [Flammula alnicola]|nr:hypothetical protein BDZ97DRAFT_1810022 [Flammula alnicola]
MSVSKKFDPLTDLKDLSGKVIIVTGANTGIGYATVKHLARTGAKVYLGARSEEKGKAAVAKLQQEGIRSGEVAWFSCDFGTPASAKKSAEDFLLLENRLDVLGIMHDSTDKPAQDGVTEVMMVNHFGTFQFTKSLLPLLKKTSEEADSDVRIVTVASDLHRKALGDKAKIAFKNMDEFKNFYAKERTPALSRYYVSKLANVLFSNALQRKLDSTSIICISLHPGLVNTSFASHLPFPRVASFFMWLLAKTPDEGAYNSCLAAASPLVRESPEKFKGVYLMPVGRIVEPAANTKDVGTQDDLWDTTERYLDGLNL